jgi:hypothetical protein
MKLTIKELHELSTACGFALAGEWDEYGDTDVLGAAQEKLNAEIARREARKAAKGLDKSTEKR